MVDFTTNELLKTRYTEMMKSMTKMEISSSSITITVPMVREIIDNFTEFVDTHGTEHSLNYLMDVIAFYMILCEESAKHNNALTEHIKELHERLGDGN